MDGRLARILPTQYFHVVFTLPSELRTLARRNRRVVFDLLFRCASETLLELGRDPERLGAELGITTVLHTWSRELAFHPHLHCIVTGGGLSLDAERWVSCRDGYLFPVHVIGALFRGKFLDRLRAACRGGQLVLGDHGAQPPDPQAFDRFLSQLYRKAWVVYAKQPFGGPQQVIAYLSQYTHRVAISNHRLLRMDEQGVTFRTKSGKTITLTPQVFLSRFLDHVLPSGYVKIRHYGLMASSHATTRLELARCLLNRTGDAAVPPVPPTLEQDSSSTWQQLLFRLTGVDLSRCPACGSRNIVRLPLSSLLSRAPPHAA
jgi:hypothetical protein